MEIFKGLLFKDIDYPELNEVVNCENPKFLVIAFIKDNKYQCGYSAKSSELIKRFEEGKISIINDEAERPSVFNFKKEYLELCLNHGLTIVSCEPMGIGQVKNCCTCKDEIGDDSFVYYNMIEGEEALIEIVRKL